jgi:fido (protein-threonine AMPylation protein)
MLKRVQWQALRKAAENLSINTLDSIEVVTPELINSEEFLRSIHHLLFEVN